jgi:hypothetical protein
MKDFKKEIKRACKIGDFSRVNKSITLENLTEGIDTFGNTWMHEIAFAGHLQKLPPEFLTRKTVVELWNSDKQSPLSTAISKNKSECIPWEVVEIDNMCQINQYGMTPMILAGLLAELHKIPQKYMTLKSVTKENNQRTNTLHAAAQNGQLHFIPRELLTKENLVGGNLRPPLQALKLYKVLEQKRSKLSQEIYEIKTDVKL